MCPDAEQKGFTTDIVRSIYERQGYRVTFVALPWARASAISLGDRKHALFDTLDP